MLVNRGGPGDEREWAEARRSAMTLAESGNLLIMRNRATAWVADARLLTDVGTAAYKAAEAKDAKALAALTARIDASCTSATGSSGRRCSRRPASSGVVAPNTQAAVERHTP